MNFKNKINFLFILTAASSAIDAASKEESVIIAPGKIFEACMPLKQGEELRYSFSADSSLVFNLHYHVDDEVIYPMPDGAKKEYSDEFIAAITQDYCLMWTNENDRSVTLDYHYTDGK
ncbi:MAG: hypothetical protein MJA83_13775 [Gammaproteobacteria bacterium]|nr:hypothetical protein [Gammaproteobacteria bacterium]